MKKEELKEGMILKTKGNGFLSVFSRNGNLFFRFEDGTNEWISLDQFDKNLNCGFISWSVVEEWHHKLLPSYDLLPMFFVAKHIYENENYNVFKSNEKLYDGVDKGVHKVSYNFNECEGHIDTTLYDEKYEHPFILDKHGEKKRVKNFILIDKNNKKETVDYEYLKSNFEMTIERVIFV